MDINDIEPTKEDHRKRIFANSAKYIKASFILGIIVLLLSVIYVFEANVLYWIVKRLPEHLEKIPTYIFGAIILAGAVLAAVLGGFSFRKEKNIYGILGFILSLIVIGFVLYMIILTHRITWPD